MSTIFGDGASTAHMKNSEQVEKHTGKKCAYIQLHAYAHWGSARRAPSATTGDVAEHEREAMEGDVVMQSPAKDAIVQDNEERERVNVSSSIAVCPIRKLRVRNELHRYSISLAETIGEQLAHLQATSCDLNIHFGNLFH